jgi:hypothetical protein
MSSADMEILQDLTFQSGPSQTAPRSPSGWRANGLSLACFPSGNVGLTISGDLVDGSTEAGQRAEHIRIDLSRVRLSGDRVGVWEAEQLRHSLVQRLNLVVSVSVRDTCERECPPWRDRRRREPGTILGYRSYP